MLLVKALKDYLSVPILGASLVSLVFPMIILSVIVFMGGMHLWETLQTLEAGQSLALETAPGWFETLLGYAFIQWIFITLFYALGGVLTLLLSIIIAVIIIGFLTPWLVGILRQRHYVNFDMPRGLSFWEISREVFGILWKFLGIFLLSLVLLFIPFVNIIALHVPFFYLFYRILLLDVGSVMLNFKEYKRFKTVYHNELFIIGFICFILALIPFVGLFLQPLFVLYLAHYVFQKVLLLECQPITNEN
ncbi:MAG: EI24 domain-containing protein [Campylobacteraceae bacterium]|nr:EI24 domain-containing protein [Campylobacteraceae bacterium]